ncbi:HlyD family efflux transporter periplasmic adaptor subunit [Pyruvatibacter sp.]|uniref:HlyD family secretion protein n=1 Tax=Pyruvatibacter sp. TaxID=1981328 RepID=UPI00326681E7
MTTLLHRIALVLCAPLALLACGQESEGHIYTGYVEAELVYVAAPASGWLTNAPLLEGQTVSTGDLVFELDNDLQTAAVEEATARLDQAIAQLADLEKGVRSQEMKAFEAQLAEANADLQLARSERDRSLTLVRRGVAAKARGDEATARYGVALARVDTATANVESAKLAARDDAVDAAAAARDAAADALTQAQWHRDQRNVRAKTSGSVEEVFTRTGEFVSAGTPVMAILPDRGLKVRFFVPQSDLALVQHEGAVQIVADALDQPIAARITHIAREAEFTPPVIYSEESRDTLVFLVEAKPLDGSVLRPGQPVDVRLP